MNRYQLIGATVLFFLVITFCGGIITYFSIGIPVERMGANPPSLGATTTLAGIVAAFTFPIWGKVALS